MWGGSASGALLADGYQADPEDAVIRARRYLVDGLMDGVIDHLMDGRAVQTAVFSLPAESSPEPHPSGRLSIGGMPAGQRRNEHISAGSATMHQVTRRCSSVGRAAVL